MPPAGLSPKDHTPVPPRWERGPFPASLGGAQPPSRGAVSCSGAPRPGRQALTFPCSSQTTWGHGCVWGGRGTWAPPTPRLSSEAGTGAHPAPGGHQAPARGRDCTVGHTLGLHSRGPKTSRPPHVPGQHTLEDATSPNQPTRPAEGDRRQVAPASLRPRPPSGTERATRPGSARATHGEDGHVRVEQLRDHVRREQRLQDADVHLRGQLRVAHHLCTAAKPGARRRVSGQTGRSAKCRPFLGHASARASSRPWRGGAGPGERRAGAGPTGPLCPWPQPAALRKASPERSRARPTPSPRGGPGPGEAEGPAGRCRQPRHDQHARAAEAQAEVGRAAPRAS